MHRWCVHPSTKAHKHLFNIQKQERKKRDDEITQKQNGTDSLHQWKGVGGGRWRSVGQYTTAHRPWLGNGKRWAQTRYFSFLSSHWFILWNLDERTTKEYFVERPLLSWRETTPSLMRAHLYFDERPLLFSELWIPDNSHDSCECTPNRKPRTFHTRLVWFFWPYLMRGPTVIIIFCYKKQWSTIYVYCITWCIYITEKNWGKFWDILVIYGAILIPLSFRVGTKKTCSKPESIFATKHDTIITTVHYI